VNLQRFWDATVAPRALLLCARSGRFGPRQASVAPSPASGAGATVVVLIGSAHSFVVLVSGVGQCARVPAFLADLRHTIAAYGHRMAGPTRAYVLGCSGEVAGLTPISQVGFLASNPTVWVGYGWFNGSGWAGWSRRVEVASENEAKSAILSTRHDQVNVPLWAGHGCPPLSGREGKD